MRLAINALSSTNLSARYVLAGHLQQMLLAGDEHEFVLLHHPSNADLAKRHQHERVRAIACPEFTSTWAGRTAWERLMLPRELKKQSVDAILTFSGADLPNAAVPVWSHAMNPWALVPEVHTNFRERQKAALQKRAYVAAVKRVEALVYISGYLQSAYEQAAGQKTLNGMVAHTALDDDIWQTRDSEIAEREPNTILCVSLMGPHKGVETVLRAMAELRRQGSDAKLEIVGGWPDPAYKRDIEQLQQELKLTDCVILRGHVDRAELLRCYARARVFCLMSWCESFGIPALEAQAFGTPTVSSNRCAIPEVCADGGSYPPAGDVAATARELARMLDDQAHWQQHSQAAYNNASQFVWSRTSQPFIDLLTSG